jgi:phosphoribosyl-ATP pyrophosphohydrolase/phosphoribosyl-AMP cyclohydrolase
VNRSGQDAGTSLERTVAPGDVRFGPDGLVAAVVQDALDGRVLMVGWQDAEALQATMRTGEVHFHSRSRGRLWRKGDTSGHTLRLVTASLDCDADAVLLRVEPAGPTCHSGARSCFDLTPGDGDAGRTASLQHPAVQGFSWLETLWATIDERARLRPAGSYTARLLAGGVDPAGRKVVEEATEVLIAAKDDASAGGSGPSRATLAGELADLLYHALVLCAERRLPPGEVIAALRARHGAPARGS